MSLKVTLGLHSLNKQKREGSEFKLQIGDKLKTKRILKMTICISGIVSKCCSFDDGGEPCPTSSSNNLQS